VNDLEELYIHATAIVCPIFSGSGMKTKMIEALRYGKYIFATSEAFEGIDVDFVKIGGLCNTNNEFVNSINTSNITNKFNEYSYSVLKNRYSNFSVFQQFENYIFDHLKHENISK
jgi:hypothetical protein